jgi:AcrR family transcriptional regulator
MSPAIAARSRNPSGASATATGATGRTASHGDGRGDVVSLQRARIVSAMVEVVAERGVARATVAHVVARSGVSRRTFYELFTDREDCFLAAFDQAVERAAARVLPTWDAQASWLQRTRAGLRALLEFLDDEPGFGRLALVEALGAGAAALERRRRVVGVLIDAVDEGRREPRRSSKLTRLTAEGVVGAVLAVLHARLTEPRGSEPRGSQSRPAPIVGMLGPLMSLIVLPYYGRAVAEREASRPVPRRRPAVRPPADPLLDLEMRLTYRTVRVLAAIAALGGSRSTGRRAPSNREVADAAGVSDQGQISKLLARLEHLGLIANDGEGQARGEPNAWCLTPKGLDVERRIGRQSEQLAG